MSDAIAATFLFPAFSVRAPRRGLVDSNEIIVSDRFERNNYLPKITFAKNNWSSGLICIPDKCHY